ncbi:MAG: UDP-N-acetylglucosamine 2-epimerase (hydrolyzing) [Cellvibrio sp.]|nr:UDP-N-acetylglucosamine 2-epimerase (hydrolyzing) [Cellvibrio sp.]
MEDVRKICYLSGTRADFGLMRSALCAINDSPLFSLTIIATGMHLSAKFGNTINEIKAAGLNVAAEIAAPIEAMTGSEMAHNIALILDGCVSVLEEIKPDILIILGDRGEMLAAALAAIHLNVPVVHIHGGERSGTVDEPVRHAISKLSHFHFVSTLDACERLIKMGELQQNIFITGAPGLDGLKSLVVYNREELFNELHLDVNKPVALMVFHPVLQEANSAGEAATCILNSLINRSVQVVALKPNSDAGSVDILKVLEAFNDNSFVRVVTHFPREKFASWMAAADLMIGNSSAGIIEAASFGIPVINVGLRQNLRERNKNTIDVGLNSEDIEIAIDGALNHGRYDPVNVYGDGRTATKILALLSRLPLDKQVLYKTNAY